MHQLLVRRFIFPLHEFLRRRPTTSYLSQLEKSQWLSTESLRQLQWRKLHDLLNHAYYYVPYYREVFRQLGLDPSQITTEEEFRRLPFLTKDIVRAQSKNLIALNYQGKLIRYSTGGSTGEPLVFYTDYKKEAAHNAAKLRARQWWGVDVGDRQIDLWGSPIELSKQDWFRVFKDKYFLNLILLSAFNMTPERIHQYLKIMHDFNPSILYGYASIFYRIAQFCEQERLLLHLPNLKVIVTTSEMLYEHQREIISRAFQAPVANEYGCRDGGYIAQECPKGRLHIAMEHVYVEFLPIKNDTEGLAEVVITNLDGYGMPFIRYRVGDLATPGFDECPCGRGLSIMTSIKGRDNDLLVSPTGKTLHSLSFIYILREVKGIDQFRVTQDTVNDLTIEIVKNIRYQHDDEENIRSQILKLMEAPVNIRFIYCPTIDREQSGKYRWIRSRVSPSI